MKVNIKYYTPKNWDEFNDYQYLKLSKLYCSNLSQRAFNLQLYIIALIPKWSFKNVIKLIFAFVNLPVDEVLNELSFLKVQVNRTKFPEYFKVGKRRFYGPGIRMTDIGTHEFALAYFFYSRFTKSRSEGDLNGLVSCLYREKVKNVKKRFCKEDLEFIGGNIAKLPYRAKFMVYLAFQGSLNVLARYYPKVFKKQLKTTNSKRTWDDVIHEYSELNNNGLGNLYDVRDSNVYDFMKKLNAKTK